jgi:hypothetical protein
MQKKQAITLAFGLGLLAACGGGGADRGIETLGPVFQQAFAQGPNDTPLDITNAGLQVQLTQDPFAL